jgi:hypothetical protein
MEMNEIYGDINSVKLIISKLDETNDETLVSQMIYAIGTYNNLLYKDLPFLSPIIINRNLLPLSIDRYKFWTQKYIIGEFVKNRKISKYQEEGVLSYTLYVDLNDEEWGYIKDEKNFYSLNDFIRNNPKYIDNENEIPTPIQKVLIRKLIFKEKEKAELYNILQSYKSKPIIAKPLVILIFAVIIYLLFRYMF